MPLSVFIVCLNFPSGFPMLFADLPSIFYVSSSILLLFFFLLPLKSPLHILECSFGLRPCFSGLISNQPETWKHVSEAYCGNLFYKREKSCVLMSLCAE